MNITTSPVIVSVTPAIFQDGQKILYVLSSLLFIFIWQRIWKVSKRPFVYNNSSFFDRISICYYFTAAAMTGLVVCVTFPHAMLRALVGFAPVNLVAAPIASFGILVGIGINYSTYYYKRVNHPNDDYVEPDRVCEKEEPLLNSKNIEDNEYLIVTGKHISDELYPHHITAMDKVTDKLRRRFFSMLCYIAVMYITIMDGFFVVYWSDKTMDPTGLWLLVIAACVIKLTYAGIVCTILIHGQYHTIQMDKWYKYPIGFHALCGYYFLALVLCSMPMLLDKTVFQVARTVNNEFFIFFYGIMTGILVWNSAYYMWVQHPEPTKKSVIRQILLFWSVVILLGFAALFI